MSQVEHLTTPHGDQDWAGWTVHSRDGARLGRVAEVDAGWAVVRSGLGRRRLVPLDGAVPVGDHRLKLSVDRVDLRTAPAVSTARPGSANQQALAAHFAGRRMLTEAQDRRHERHGGAKFGAGAFGWLVAVCMTVLLTAVVGALAEAAGQTRPSFLATALGVVGVLVVAYYTGGYVAGRLARFDGARNGMLAWGIGALATLAATVTDSIRVELLTSMRLPAAPLAVAHPAIGGILTICVTAVGTLLAALLGGTAGQRYHDRIDRAGMRSP